MSVTDGAMVCAPVVHHIISSGKCALPGGPWSEPGTGPGVIRTLPQYIRYFLWQMNGPALRNLQHRPQALHQVQANHGGRHLSLGYEAGGESSAPEIPAVGIVPGGCRHNSLLVLFRHLIPGLHDAVALRILCLSAGIQTGCAGVNQMDKSARLLCNPLQLIAGGLLHRLGTPVSTHISENLSTIGQQLHKQHAQTVQHIVLRGQNIRLSGPIPVKGGIQHGLGEVTVRVEVGPLPLSLEACGDGIVTHHLLFPALRKILVPIHQVLDDTHHLHHELPVLILLLPCLLYFFRILVKAFLTVFFRPGKSLLIFLLVINTL